MRSHTIGRVTCCCAKPVGESLNGISKIAEQVPSIGNLYDARRTLTDVVGINAGSIARDNFDTG